MSDIIQELEVSNDQSIPLAVSIKDLTGTDCVDVVNVGTKNRLCVDTNIGGIGKDTQTSAFGLLKIANESTLADYRFDAISTPDKFTVSIVNGASYSIEPGGTGIKLSSSTNTNSKIQLDSKQTHYYQSGRGQMAKFSIILGDTGVAGNIREWGYGDDNNGFFCRLNGTTLSLVIKYNGSETIIPSNTWNTPTTISSNGHLWYFQFQWLGVGNLYLWYDEKIVHTYEFLGTSTNLSIGIPDLPIRLKNENTTNNTNVYMKCGCASVVTEGGTLIEGQDPNGQLRSLTSDTSGNQTIRLVGDNSSDLVAVIKDSDDIYRLAVNLRGGALDFAEYAVIGTTRVQKVGGADQVVFSITANDVGGKDIFITSVTLGCDNSKGGILFYNNTLSINYVYVVVPAGATFQHQFSKAVRIKNGETFRIALLGAYTSNNAWYFVSYDGFEFKP